MRVTETEFSSQCLNAGKCSSCDSWQAFVRIEIVSVVWPRTALFVATDNRKCRTIVGGRIE